MRIIHIGCERVWVTFSNGQSWQGTNLYGQIFAIFSCRRFFPVGNVHVGPSGLALLSQKARRLILYKGVMGCFLFQAISLHTSFHILSHFTIHSIFHLNTSFIPHFTHFILHSAFPLTPHFISNFLSLHASFHISSHFTFHSTFFLTTCFIPHFL